MIQAVTTPAHKQAFATAIQGAPYFRAVMGRDLPCGQITPVPRCGSSPCPCGPDPERQHRPAVRHPPGLGGTAKLFAVCGHRPSDCGRNAPTTAAAGEPLFLYSMPPQDRLPLAQEHQGYMLNRSPSVLRLATQLFPQEPERQDCYYSETCTALAHGFARVLALQDAAGRPVSTVGAYAMANGEAYMAMGETLPELRGRGIGGWLIPYLANELAGEGWTVTFLCAAERCRFYERLGFVLQKQYVKYKL